MSMTRPPLYVRRPFLAGLVRQLPLLAVLVVGRRRAAAGRPSSTGGAGSSSSGLALRRRGALLRLLPAGAPGRASSPSAAGRWTSSCSPAPVLALTVIALAIPGRLTRRRPAAARRRRAGA